VTAGYGRVSGFKQTPDSLGKRQRSWNSKALVLEILLSGSSIAQ